MARPKGTKKREDTVVKSIAFDRSAADAAQALASERGMTFTALVGQAVMAEIERARKTTGGGGMWRIMVTGFDGEIIEKSELSGPDETIDAWERAWANPEYSGQRLKLLLLERSTIKLSHRFDFAPDVFGYLPRDAARDFFS